MMASFLFAETPKPNMTLKDIENRTRETLTEIKSELTFEYPQNTSYLLVKYKTQKFMVHDKFKTGKVSEKARETEGPSDKGFMLRMHIEDKGTIHQADIPQRIHETYWDTDLNETVINNTEKQICWSLSFGTRTDKKLLEKIKNIIVDIVK